MHSFGNGSDGLTPAAPLIQVDGMLYGTTAQGGAYGCGTVFSLSTGGRERVLYSFGSAANDGCEPDAGLIAIGTTLFGTTGYGGAYDKGGTVFSLATDGSNERILHSFGSGSDGKNPVAAFTSSTACFTEPRKRRYWRPRHRFCSKPVTQGSLRVRSAAV